MLKAGPAPRVTTIGALLIHAMDSYAALDYTRTLLEVAAPEHMQSAWGQIEGRWADRWWRVTAKARVNTTLSTTQTGV